MKRNLLSLLILITIHNLSAQTFGNSIAFDGIDDFMMVPHHESLNPGTDSWTITLWIKAPNMEQDGPLVRKRLAEEGYNQYNLGIGHTDPHHPTLGKRLIYNYIDYSGVSERSGHLQNEFVDGFWHHIAVVANKSADSVFIYIDGAKQVFIMQYNFGEWPNVGNLDSVLVGRDTGGSDLYTGEMDELSIWRKALNINQIQQMMFDTLSSEYYATADSGLVAYYRFDTYEDLGINGGGMDDFRDYSSWENHGDSEGNPELIPSGIFVGTNEKQETYDIQLYPNPAAGLVHISLAGIMQQLVVIDICDLHGRTLMQGQLHPGDKFIKLNVSSLPNGLYFVQLQTENQTVTKKLIIQ